MVFDENSIRRALPSSYAVRTQFQSPYRRLRDQSEANDENSGTDSNTRTFLKDFCDRWIELNPKATLGFVQPGCRGLVANSAIDADEVLMSISRDHVMTVENTLRDRDDGEEGRANRAQLAHILQPLSPWPWLSLILVLLYEKFSSRSDWAPYFAVAPYEFDTLIWWTPEELEELQASAVVSKIGKQEADDMFQEKLVPIVLENSELFAYREGEHGDRGEWQNMILHEAHLMASMIMAYGFDLEPETRDVDDDGYATEEEDADLPKAIVPLADMLNADADRNNARLYYEPGKLVMKALTPIAAGEEIFNDYGSLPRSDLLRRYGYLTPNYTKYDVVEISLDLVKAVVEEFGKSGEIGDAGRVLSRLQVIADDDFPDGFDVARRETAENMAQLFEEILPVLQYILPPGPEWAEKRIVEDGSLPPLWVAVLVEVLKRRLGEYGTSLNEDREILRSRQRQLDANSLPTSRRGGGAAKETLEQGIDAHFSLKRRIMAIEVRIGEKEILHEATNWLQESMEIVESENPRKRRKVL